MVVGGIKSLAIVCHLYQQKPSKSIPSHVLSPYLGALSCVLDLQLKEQDHNKAKNCAL